MSILNYCCGCIPLRGGSLAIGVLTLIVFLLALLIEGNTFYYTFTWTEEPVKGVNNATGEPTINGIPEDQYNEVFWRLLITQSLLITHYVIGIVCAALLIYGVRKHRKNFMIPYLGLEGVVVAIIAISILYVLITGQRGYGTTAAAVLLTFYLGLQLYFWLIVYSLYQEYRDDDLRVNLPSRQSPYNPDMQVSYSQVAKA